MDIADFNFQLPDELIAHFPASQRTDSRLLSLQGATGAIEHGHFSDILRLLKPNDLLVFNDTKVIPARVYGQKDSGGQLEVLVERITTPSHCLAQIRASRSPKPGSSLRLDGDVLVQVTGREGDLFQLLLESGASSWLDYLEQFGHMPLPPYIARDDETVDRSRYQTVYAKHPGAVAAPTAGLHFDEALLAAIRSAGIDCAEVTLHVGAGTFQPIRVDKVENHQMHSERVRVSSETCDKVRRCKARGGRVIAVGTTSVRSLESASQSGAITPFEGETDIFIYPGYAFKTVDVLITNFHLPQSSLLLLVCAFAGKGNILTAYQEAIQKKYRFYSYGDAMFLEKKPDDATARGGSSYEEARS